MPFTPTPSDFFWATGIEDTFIPQMRPGLRRLDEYELTQHYQRWQSDFDLVSALGVKYLRWGIPWYKVQPEPDRWDWAWSDAALEYLVNCCGITPILDLMHYGTPSWLENSFINASYAERVAEYAARAMERYRGLVRWVTPLNEPSVNADMCGRQAQWPPYLCGEDGFVKVLVAIARGIVKTVHALRCIEPDLTLVQVEALWHNWTRSTSPALLQRIAEGNARQYLCFDLTTGRVNASHMLYPYLRANGVSDDDLAWFQKNAVTFDIFGANFYPWSYNQVEERRDGRIQRVAGPEVSGTAIEKVLCESYQRYHLPVMVTETSSKGSIARRNQWMDETIGAVCNLRQQGMPLVGYTWFPLFTMFDWKYRTGRRPAQDYLLHLGLYDAAYDEHGNLPRLTTPLVARYQQHMAQPMPDLEAPLRA